MGRGAGCHGSRVVGVRWIAVLLAAAPVAVGAQTDSARMLADSTHTAGAHAPGPLFSRRDAWIGLGFVAATAAALPLDQRVAYNLQLPQNQNEPGLVRASAVFRNIADPGTVYIGTGMYAAGLLFQNRTLADIGLHASESLAIASVAGFVLKGIVGRPLPRQHNADADSYVFGRGVRVDGNWQAFPSGHTLAVFSIASAVTAEAQDRWPSHGTLVGVFTYGVASAAGISRLYNNAHWVSDVIFGAGIGIFSGIKTVQYAHTHPGNWVDRLLLHASLAPAPGGAAAAFHFGQL